MTLKLSRLVAFVVLGALVLLGPGPRAASPAGQRDTGGTPGKSVTASGTVSAVAPDTLIVKGTGSETWTFIINKDTSVTAKGATHKSLALKADGKSTVLPDFVKIGDKVSIAYFDMGSMKQASRINVTAIPAPK